MVLNLMSLYLVGNINMSSDLEVHMYTIDTRISVRTCIPSRQSIYLSCVFSVFLPQPNSRHALTLYGWFSWPTTAVVVAIHDKMDLAMGVAIRSSNYSPGHVPCYFWLDHWSGYDPFL